MKKVIKKHGSKPTPTETPLGKKVRAARKALGWNQGELARRVGVSQTTITQIETGIIDRPKMLPEIARELKRDLNWFIEPESNGDDPEIAARARDLAKRVLEPGEVVERNVTAQLGLGGLGQEIMVNGIAVDDIRAVWRFPPEFLRSELRAAETDIDILPVDGDSMLPTLAPGDRVLVNRRHVAPSPDGLYAIFDGIGVAIKRIEVMQGSDPIQLKIISDNPKHGTYEQSAENLTIIGRVICRVSRL